MSNVIDMLESRRIALCGVFFDDEHKEYTTELISLAKLGAEITPDKVLMYRDEIDRMNRDMKEKDRQTEECYTIMKFEQDRANKAVEALRQIEALIKPMRLYHLLDKREYALRKAYSLAQKGLKEAQL